MLVLSACTEPEPSSSEPAAPAAPEVVWEVEHGTLELESDPLVQTVRAAELAQALAAATGDFTREDLVETWTPPAIGRAWDTLERSVRDDAVRSYLGPPVSAPVSVDTTDEGASVSMCDASVNRWVSPDHEPAEDFATGLLRRYDLVESADGEWLVDEASAGGVPCDATGARVGSFDPEPPARSPLTVENVVPPADAD